MYVSSAAKPVNQPDALRLLLDRILRGADAALIAEGEASRVLLDLAADCLSGQRIRTVRAAEALPSSLAAPTPAAQAARQAKASVPDDEALSRSFRALTVLDQACDRIVLLVGGADALPLPALRFIQFASRSAPHLQLVFCGTQAFFDMLNGEGLAWLRARLTAGPILALAAPVMEGADAPPVATAPPDAPAAWAGEAAAPLSRAERPTVSASKRSRALPLGALFLLGLGSAAALVLGMQGAHEPAASRQTSAIQPPTPPNAASPGTPGTGAASRADPEAPAALGALPPHPPAMAGGAAQGAGPGSPPGEQPAPPSAGVPGPLVTVRSQPKAGVPDEQPELPTGLARSANPPAAPAAPSRAAAAAPGSRGRRVREAREQAAPPRDDRWAPSQPAFGSWMPPPSQPPRYIGSYAADANGVRMFRSEP